MKNDQNGVRILGVNGKEFTSEELNADLRKRAHELEVQKKERVELKDEILKYMVHKKNNRIIGDDGTPRQSK